MDIRKVLSILAFLAIISTITGGYLYYSALKAAALQEAQKEAVFHTKRIANHIGSNLSKHQKAVEALAGLIELKQALTSKDASQISKANSILDHFNNSLQVSVSYLMDLEGNTIASSNRKARDSFVGKNYAFRPYFKQAMGGLPYIYMALGVTSGKRGMYFSHPVYEASDKMPIGVAVIKDSIEEIEKEINQEYDGVMLFADSHGVIFVTNRKDWLYQVLWRVSAPETQAISETRQFGKGPWHWTGMERKDANRAKDKAGNEYFIHQSGISNYPGWRVIYLHDFESVLNKISSPLFKTAVPIILGLCFLMGIAVLMLYKQASYDIIQRQKAEALLRKERDKAQNYLDIAGVMIVVLQADQTVALINKKGAEILGYTVEDIIGKNWFETFVPARHQDQLQSHFLKLMEDEIESVEHYENPVVTKAGIERLISWHNTVLKDEAGNITATLSSGEDISEQKHAEQARIEQEKLQGIIEMSGAVCHEMNQPLMAISGYSELMLMDPVEDGSAKERLTKIREQVERLAKITQKLMKITKYETKEYLNGKIIDIDKAAE